MMIDAVLYVTGQAWYVGLAHCHIVAGALFCVQDQVPWWMI
jgi:hypothetical protein